LEGRRPAKKYVMLACQRFLDGIKGVNGYVDADSVQHDFAFLVPRTTSTDEV
jgi:hypothetical protein